MRPANAKKETKLLLQIAANIHERKNQTEQNRTEPNKTKWNAERRKKRVKS